MDKGIIIPSYTMLHPPMLARHILPFLLWGRVTDFILKMDGITVSWDPILEVVHNMNFIYIHLKRENKVIFVT